MALHSHVDGTLGGRPERVGGIPETWVPTNTMLVVPGTIWVYLPNFPAGRREKGKGDYLGIWQIDPNSTTYLILLVIGWIVIHTLGGCDGLWNPIELDLRLQLNIQHHISMGAEC